MQPRAFGRTGLEVSPITLGSWPMSGDRYGAIDDSEAVQTIRRAQDTGITSFDTAPGYGIGHAEETLGAALEGRRAQAIVTTDRWAKFACLEVSLNGGVVRLRSALWPAKIQGSKTSCPASVATHRPFCKAPDPHGLMQGKPWGRRCWPRIRIDSRISLRSASAARPASSETV